MCSNENKSLRGFGEELLNGPGSNNSGRGDEFDGQLNAGYDVIDDVLGIAAMEFLDQTLKVLQSQELHFYIRRKDTLTSQKLFIILVTWLYEITSNKKYQCQNLCRHTIACRFRRHLLQWVCSDIRSKE